MKHLKFKNLLLLVAITTGLASCGGNNSNTSSSTSNSGGGETPISSSSTSSSGSTLDSSTSSTNTGDTEQMIKEGVYYRSPKIASKVYVVDARKLTKAERIMLVSLQGILAQEESRSVSENMKWRVKKNFEEGLSWGTHLYGYKYENNQYEVIPEEAKVVKKIFDLYIEVNGVQAITKILEAEGIKTRNNIFFSKSTIRGMLSNEYYTGDKILQKTYSKDFISKRTLINNGELTKYYVEDSHEGIISKEDFNKVQEMLKSKKESINWKVTKPLILPFSGMLECGCCGKHYSRKTTPYKHI